MRIAEDRRAKRLVRADGSQPVRPVDLHGLLVPTRQQERVRLVGADEELRRVDPQCFGGGRERFRGAMRQQQRPRLATQRGGQVHRVSMRSVGKMGQPSAHGWFVHVFVDRATRRPAPLPASIRDALERLRLLTLRSGP